jgi:uncharacterized protein with HEPN domain
MVQDAVVRNLEIVGEAAKHVTPVPRDEHQTSTSKWTINSDSVPEQELPSWRALTGIRTRPLRNTALVAVRI